MRFQSELGRETWGLAREVWGFRYGVGATPHFYGALVHEACMKSTGDTSNRERILEVIILIRDAISKVGPEFADEALSSSYSRADFANLLAGIALDQPY